MFLYKDKQANCLSAIGAPGTMDLEGRIITLEFDDFFLTQVYTLNAGEDLGRLKARSGT